MKYTFILWVCFLVLHEYANGGSGWLKQFHDDVQKIKDYMNDLKQNKGRPYRRLAYTTDKYGSRLVGSEGLEKSLNVIRNDSGKVQFDLYEEGITVINWKELHSKAELHSTFRNKSLSIIAYGPSEKTEGKVNAQILLVKNFSELKSRSSEVKGKIVVYNQKCKDYVTCVKYRNDGAAEAAKLGAVASLTRTVSFSSINNLHTGPVIYRDKDKTKNIPKIPAAAITVEDVAFIERIILNHDANATIDLDISTETKDGKSKNIVIDIPGTDLKHQVILSGTHTDSWHVGEGIANNAVGLNILYESMRVIKSLDLKPRRTLRLALWTAGEQNARGERKFFEKQLDSVNEEVKLLMRSEKGFFNISGFNIDNDEKIKVPVQDILDEYFQNWNLVIESKPTENKKWLEKKTFPRMEFLTNIGRYLEVYNSGGDTLDKVTSEELDRAVTLWSIVLYLLGSADF